jgi:hypothetical protein
MDDFTKLNAMECGNPRDCHAGNSQAGASVIGRPTTKEGLS